MYYGSGTVDRSVSRQLADAAAYALGDAACTLTRWQHFSAWNDVMAAIWKVWRHTRNVWLHDAYLLFKTILPNSTLIRFETMGP